MTSRASRPRDFFPGSGGARVSDVPPHAAPGRPAGSPRLDPDALPARSLSGPRREADGPSVLVRRAPYQSFCKKVGLL